MLYFSRFPVFLFLFLITGNALADSSKYEAVSGFDLNRYLGKWYEIARLPFKYEDGLVNVTATYSLRDDGKVKVVNEGYQGTKGGKRSVAVGKAKFASSPDKGHLRVSFFWIFYADYTIIALDPEYRWALVGSSHKYLWILAREPHLDKTILDSLISHAYEMGFDTDRLIFTTQDW
ncbi:MAG: lipocalin family protein [Candidatus Latescibacterota bacterium]